MKRLLPAVAILALLILPQSAHATLITFTFEGNLDEPYGSVAIGTAYTFSYVFDDVQAPIAVNPDNNLYALDSLTLTIGTDVVTASGSTSGDSGGTIRVVDDRVSQGDGYFVVSEGLNPGFVGTVGGLIVNEIFLTFTDPLGNMLSSTDLITDINTFQLADLSLSFFQLGCEQGNTPTGNCGSQVINPRATDYFDVEAPIASIPEPSTLGLFAIGLVGLGVMRRRRATAPAAMRTQRV